MYAVYYTILDQSGGGAIFSVVLFAMYMVAARMVQADIESSKRKKSGPSAKPDESAGPTYFPLKVRASHAFQDSLRSAFTLYLPVGCSCITRHKLVGPNSSRPW